MPKFYPLTVKDVRHTTRDAVVVTFENNTDKFGFIPGQYVTFKKKFGQCEVRRSYSICCGNDEKNIKVGIKKVRGGAFSSWANQKLKKGDVIEAMKPTGNFLGENNANAKKQKNILAVAAGSGITPILSIIKTILKEPETKCALVYANKNVNTIMFREELEDLKDSHIDRFNLLHALSSADEDGLSGRLDNKKLDRLFGGWVNLKEIQKVFLCGPEKMMDMAEESLIKNGVAKKQIRRELFVGTQVGQAKRTKIKMEDEGKEEVRDEVHGQVTMDGTVSVVRMSRNQSLLEAALQNSLDAPFACRAGVCSTCKAKVTEGKVEMIANHALEDYEVNNGFVLCCQSYPVTDKIAWTYDEAGHTPRK